MKKEDLMIGNKLQIGIKGIIITVSEIYEDEFKTTEEGFISYSHPALSGIPLSEHWLLRMGYKYYNGKSSGDMTMDFAGKLDIDYVAGKIKIKSHYEGEDGYREVPIKYVHQLQNLYQTLTHEELIIKP